MIQKPIKTKLVIVLMLSGLLFVLAAAPIVIYLSYQNHWLQAKTQQARLVGAVKVSAAIAAFVGNEEIANDVIKGLLLDDEILAARIQGEKAFVAHMQANLMQDVQANTHTDYPLRSPTGENEVVGMLRVWSNDDLIYDRAIWAVVEAMTWTALMTFLLIMVVILAVNYLVGIPLKDLAQQIALIKPGEKQLIQLNKKNEGDEIGLVSSIVNNFLRITRHALDVERELRLQVERMDNHYRNIFSSTQVGIMVLDRNGIIIHHNPVLFEQFISSDKVSKETISTKPIFPEIFRHVDEAWNLVATAKKLRQSVSHDFELKNSIKSPCWVSAIISVNKNNEEKQEIVEVVLYDVTSRVLEASSAKRMAEEDPLTGLVNRRGCERILQDNLTTAGKTENIVVMLLDLDGFKAVNDSFGHAAGDTVLLVVAERLLGSVRVKTDTVGRLGGDEFLLIIEVESSRKEHVKGLAEKIIDCVSQPIKVAGFEPLTVGASIGIAFASHHKQLDELITAADKAMYEVKNSGKNNFAFAD